MTDPVAHAPGNRLLLELIATDPSWWPQRLGPVDLRLGEVLHEPGESPACVWFPTTAVVSLLHVLEDGGASEVALVGEEGMVGCATLLGASAAPSRAVVHAAGRGVRVAMVSMRQMFDRGGPPAQVVLRYVHALATQMGQTAVCNRHHVLAQRVACWLMRNFDRSASGDLEMTQEWIAQILGVRREGITESLGRLQQRGLIRNRRGHIRLVDRDGLEAQACECYRVVRGVYDEMLPPVARAAPSSGA